MNKKRTLYGISPQKVRHLLDDCIDKERSPQPSKTTLSMEELLKEYLAETCPTRLDELASTSSIIIVHVQDQILRRPGKSIAEVLSDPKTDLVTLRDIKEHYKKKSFSTDSKRVRHVATAVYFAAVAHALIFHHQKISEFSMDKIYQSLDTIATEPWITADLESLYTKAQKVCQRSNKTGKQ